MGVVVLVFSTRAGNVFALALDALGRNYGALFGYSGCKDVTGITMGFIVIFFVTL